MRGERAREERTGDKRTGDERTRDERTRDERTRDERTRDSLVLRPLSEAMAGRGVDWITQAGISVVRSSWTRHEPSCLPRRCK